MGFLRGDGVASVVVLDEGFLKEAIGLLESGNASKLHLRNEAILKGVKDPLNASLSLWRMCEDGVNSQVLEGESDLGGIAFAGQFLLKAPVVIVASMYTVAVLVDGERDTILGDHVPEQEEIPMAAFMGCEIGC